MKLNHVRAHGSITGPGGYAGGHEASDFIVLSGLNGSGKTHLLEAIADGAIEIDGHTVSRDPSLRRRQIRYFGIGQLLADTVGGKSANQVREPWIGLMQDVQNLQREFSRAGGPEEHGWPRTDEEREVRIRQAVVERNFISQTALEGAERWAKKSITAFDAEDFRVNPHILDGPQSPFTVSLVDLFLIYARRDRDNRLNRFDASEGREPAATPLTNEQFTDTFGPPPWELMNEILVSIGLPYQLNHPVGVQDGLEFAIHLKHTKDSQLDITPDQLSTGEKTLLAIAISLYTGQHLEGSIEMPLALLLDESDATLHPSQIGTLLDVLNMTFVQRHGVKVILSTHSPVTVALAPEDALYTMRRDEAPRLFKATREDALRDLMVGVPMLIVSNEHRRLVYVESDDDEVCYQELFRFMGRSMETPISLVFAAAGRGGHGGKAEVLRLVKQLRDNGNAVLGLVDRDDGQSAQLGIAFLESRYALENLILDPVVVALFLLRRHYFTTKQILGVDIPIARFEPSHAQKACDFVFEAIGNEMGSTRYAQLDKSHVVVHYEGGGQANVPSFALNMDAHKWEEQLGRTFRPLEHLVNNNKLKWAVITEGMREMEDWIPTDVRTLFDDLLALAQINPGP